MMIERCYRLGTTKGIADIQHVLRSKFSKINAGIRKRKALSVTEVFSQKDNASNFYVPSPLTSSSSQNFDGDGYDSSEPTSLPPYPFHDNLETLAEGSAPNSPNCSSPLTNASKTFTYSQSGSAYDSPILCHDQSQKDAYENVLYANSSPGCCPRSRAVLQRSNSENRDGSCRHQEHSYENVRFQRGHRSELTPSATPHSDRHLARSNSETRDHHSYENVHFQKNAKPRSQTDASFEEIHIPRVTPRKRMTDFKVGGQVNNYSNSGPGSPCVNKDDGPSSLGAERSPGKKTTRRMNSRSVANIPSSSGSSLKTWQVSGGKQKDLFYFYLHFSLFFSISRVHKTRTKA